MKTCQSSNNAVRSLKMRFSEKHDKTPALLVNDSPPETFGIHITDTSLLLMKASGESICFSNLDIHRVESPCAEYSSCTRYCQGIFGIYQLPMGDYIALIMESASSANNRTFGDLRMIQSLSFIKIPSNLPTPTYNESTKAKQLEMELLLQSTFSRHTFYFSADGAYDITRSYQHNAEHSGRLHWRNCDDRFFWNLNSIAPLIKAEEYAHPFITPVTNAWISSDDTRCGGQQMELTLISRRSRVRQGPR